MTINTNHRCDGCHGIVKNVPHKRHSIEDLERIHNPVCPGRPTERKTPKS